MTIKILLLSAAAALGCAASVSAQSAAAAGSSAAPESGRGLLGQTYSSLGYSYVDVHKSSTDFQVLGLEYNQPLNKGFDLNLSFDDGWSSKYYGTRSHQQTVNAAPVAFMTDFSWGRPFIAVDAGWLWTKDFGVRDNSFTYGADAGVEFQVTKELSITPAVSFKDASSIHVDNKWSYGVKANYWITGQWGVSAAISRDNMVNTTYSIGTSFRF